MGVGEWEEEDTEEKFGLALGFGEPTMARQKPSGFILAVKKPSSAWPPMFQPHLSCCLLHSSTLTTPFLYPGFIS